jgi:hypothetical protein
MGSINWMSFFYGVVAYWAWQHFSVMFAAKVA